MAAGFKSATVNAASVPSTQTNFPAYVDLSRIGITTLAEAQSVRVYADSGKATEWAREIVSATEMHVKVPSLTSTVTMYVDWDGVRADYAVTDTFGRNAVWSAYTVAYHMSDTTNATGNTAFNLTNRNSIAFNAGKVGNAGDSATNTNKSLYTGSTEVLNATEIQSNWTNSFWINPTSLADCTLTRCYADVGASKRMFQIGYSTTAGQGLYFFWVGSVLNFYYTGDTLSTSTWQKVDFVLGTSGALNVYINAVNVLSTTVTNFNTRADNEGLTYNWGYFGDLANSGTLFNPFSGLIDEGRLIKTPLSANWITTEYNNQNDETTFWGTWTTVGGGSPTPLLALMGVGS